MSESFEIKGKDPILVQLGEKFKPFEQNSLIRGVQVAIDTVGPQDFEFRISHGTFYPYQKIYPFTGHSNIETPRDFDEEQRTTYVLNQRGIEHPTKFENYIQVNHIDPLLKAHEPMLYDALLNLRLIVYVPVQRPDPLSGEDQVVIATYEAAPFPIIRGISFSAFYPADTGPLSSNSTLINLGVSGGLNLIVPPGMQEKLRFEFKMDRDRQRGDRR